MVTAAVHQVPTLERRIEEMELWATHRENLITTLIDRVFVLESGNQQLQLTINLLEARLEVGNEMAV